MATINTAANRIDTHVHVIPPSYAVAIDKAGGDPSGWVLPTWTKESALDAAKQNGISMSILSITSPGPAIAGHGDEGRRLTRHCNEEVQDIVNENPSNFRFFASTPSWEDVQGTLDEIDYIYTETTALGVVVMTSYGPHLLGDKKFNSIWQKLDRYKAVVFIHPSTLSVEPHLIAGWLPQPVIDYPLATTRCAVDLVYSGTMQDCKNVKVILSHGGGTLPFLVDRATGLSGTGIFAAKTSLTKDNVMDGFSRFWIDLALSSSAPQIEGILIYASPEKILYGSDFPYAPPPIVLGNTARIDKFLETDRRGKDLQGIHRDNAIKLFEGKL